MDDIDDIRDDRFDFDSLNIADGRELLDKPVQLGSTTSSSAPNLASPVSRGGFLARLGQGLLGKMVMGMTCTAIWWVIVNGVSLWGFVTATCAAIGSLGGPDAHQVKERVERIIKKAEGVVPDKGNAAPTTSLPLKDRLSKGMAEKVVEPVKTAIKEPAKQVVQKVEDRAERLQDTVEDVGEKIVGRVHASPNGSEGNFGFGRSPAEEPEEDHGSQFGFGQEARSRLGSAKEAIKGRVESAMTERERLAKLWYEKGPNGMCPGCGKPMRVSIRGTGRYGCVLCNRNSTAREIRSMGRPPMPPGFLGF